MIILSEYPLHNNGLQSVPVMVSAMTTEGRLVGKRVTVGTQAGLVTVFVHGCSAE